MEYELLKTARHDRRSYSITVGLLEGYDGENRLHDADEAIELALLWMAERAAEGLDFLTGVFTPGTLAYAWKGTGGVEALTEPVLVFTGEVSVTYHAHLDDEQVVNLLRELAALLGDALGQTRVYMTFLETAMVIQAVGKTSPRQEFRPLHS